MSYSKLRGLALAAVSVFALSACETAEQIEAKRIQAEAAAAAERARLTPPIRFSDQLAQDASIYVSYTRDLAALRGGFESPQAVQAALQRGASYDPAQISRGMIAYASVLALQSPEFVAGIREYAPDAASRQQIIATIQADPGYAGEFPGAGHAAGLIMAALGADIQALADSANSIENDAYSIQGYGDPRRTWAIQPIVDRDARLQDAKSRSAQHMLPAAAEAARLGEAARNGRGLNATTDRLREGPFPPVVEKALALAVLAALGAADETNASMTEPLLLEPTNQRCLELSKLMLFQCLAASRPSYEDMFCVGRHAVRDLGTCARGAALPAARVTVSDIRTVAEPAPRPPIVITPAPVPVPAAPTQSPAQNPAPVTVQSTPAPASPTSLSPTQRLNTSPGGGR